MTATRTRRAFACIAAIAALSAAARADDPPVDAATAEKPKVEGDVRVGWRFLSGEGDGRFQQDVGLKDGPRLLDFNVLATGIGDRTPFDEAEAHIDGVGDRDSDYLLAVRKRDVLDISGGYRRDDSVYSASGDIFPYDTLRERSFVHVRLTPSHALAVHFDWDRTSQTANSPNGGYSEILPNDSAATYHEALPRTVRFTGLTDDFAAGAEYATGIWRFGLTQSIRLGQTDQVGSIAATASGQQLHDDVEQSTRLRTYATTGKAGVTLFDKKLDVTLFVTYLDTPLTARANGNSLGLDADGNPQSHSFDETSDLHQTDLVWRLESSWRPHKDWEFTAAADRGNQVTDESVYQLGAAYPVLRDQVNWRIIDRTQRLSGDVMWDATENLRLRAGEQYLYEDLVDPSNSHFDETAGTNFTSMSWRTTVGADLTSKDKVWSVGALAHHTTNDAPQTTAVPDYGNDWSLRGRWRPSDEFTATLLWRHVAATHSGAVDLSAINAGTGSASTNLGSATRSDSLSGSASWTHAQWTVSGTGTIRTFDTTSDTAYVVTGAKVFDTVGFSGQDVVANLDVRYEFTKSLRAFTALTGTDATGDYTARWLQFTLGAEHDLRKNLTVGVTVSTWRLRQEPSGGDNYRTYGAEVSLTYRF